MLRQKARLITACPVNGFFRNPPKRWLRRAAATVTEYRLFCRISVSSTKLGELLLEYASEFLHQCSRGVRFLNEPGNPFTGKPANRFYFVISAGEDHVDIRVDPFQASE